MTHSHPGPRPPIDPVDRALLSGESRPTPPIWRYAPAPDLTAIVARYWVPVWSLAAPQTQRTLQYPVCLLVVSDTYARVYGPSRGLSAVTLADDGWAVGTMFTPAAGRSLIGAPVSTLTDRWLDVGAVASLAPGGSGSGSGSGSVVARVRAAMATTPADPAAHSAAIEVLEGCFRALAAPDAGADLAGRVVAWIAARPDVTRVASVAAAFDTGERTLQRLLLDRVGLTPKWLIQRRRLHDAVERLKRGDGTLAGIAADLGYTDQAHFTHDFRTVTGLTPGEFAADQPR